MATSNAKASSGLMYSSLDLDTTSIRLIDLLPAEKGADIIQVRLYTVERTPSLQFAALSYVWGDESENTEIIVNNRAFPIRRNLKAALWHLRKHGMLAFEGRSLPLWVDALCINQHDNSERNHQVAQMGSIYRDATIVLSWLGTGDDDMKGALRAVKAIAKAVMGSAENENPGHGMERVNDIDVQKGLAWVASHRDFWQLSSSTSKHAPWYMIAEIPSLEYWTRTWIVQELVLANEERLVFVYDDEVFTYVDLLGFYKFYSNLCLTQPPRPDTDNFVITEECWESFRNPHFLQFDFIETIKNFKHGCMSVHDILRLAKYARSTDPRDMVFGLAGVTNRTQPDYNKKAKEIYLEWFQECFDASPKTALTHLLQSGSGIFITPSQAIGVESLDLPSWMPRLFSLATSRPMGKGSTGGHLNLDHLFDQSPPNLNYNVLAVYGIKYDQVVATLATNTGPIPYNSAPRDPSQVLCEFFREFLHWVEHNKFPNMPHPLYNLFVVLFRGWDFLLRQHISQGVRYERGVARLFQSVLQQGNQAADDAVGYGDGSPRHTNDGPHSREYGKFARLEPYFLDSPASDHDGFDTPSFKLPAPSEWEARILRRRWRSMCEQRLFITKSGNLGVGPFGMAPDDYVCVIGGCDLPFILRDHGGSRWELIGACWVLGIMNGELREKVERGEFGIEKFELE
ncbi:heterokaryon incompatibility protein-domain-containing protein [Hypoxylon rubiginosum]|uniref:Heterokaryon incompatibility protein-domain-containing protein n=1 Tax=Hypoxylon rubiginosum TaxID=110542 RepID=A0ACC0DCU6_9PEZI|nr:heterokaryon incompatibility protein-domain-containing protein [Hypoxylon rubiginosum]